MIPDILDESVEAWDHIFSNGQSFTRTWMLPAGICGKGVGPRAADINCDHCEGLKKGIKTNSEHAYKII